MVSKLNADRKAGEGAGQAVTRIYGSIGFRGLWNGLPVRIFMIGTLTVSSTDNMPPSFEHMVTNNYRPSNGSSTTRLRFTSV